MFLNSLNVNVHLPIISESQILWQVWQLETGVRFCSASERSLAFPSSSPLQSPAWPGRQCGCKVSAQDFSGCLIVLGLNHKVAVRINSHQCASIRPFQTYWKWNLFNPKYQKLTQFLKRREKILQHGYDQEQGKSQKTHRRHKDVTFLPSPTSKATMLSNNDPWQSCMRWNTKCIQIISNLCSEDVELRRQACQVCTTSGVCFAASHFLYVVLSCSFRRILDVLALAFWAVHKAFEADGITNKPGNKQVND